MNHTRIPSGRCWLAALFCLPAVVLGASVAKLVVAELDTGEEQADEADDGPEWQGLEKADYEQIQAEARRWFRRHLTDVRAAPASGKPVLRPGPGGSVR